MRNLSVRLNGTLLWAAGSLAILEGGRWWRGDELQPLGAPSRTSGQDALGSFDRRACTYQVGAAHVELSVRAYTDRLVFEQRFPHGLNATSPSSSPLSSKDDEGVTGTPPLSSWPSLSLSAGASSSYAWRSWHGTYGSFTGRGLTASKARRLCQP